MALMKFLLPVAMIALTNVGRIARCQVAVENDIKQCIIGVHCKLGPDVLKQAMECFNMLDSQTVSEIEEWVENEGHAGFIGLSNPDLVDRGCLLTDEEIDALIDPMSKKFSEKYSESCKNPLSAECDQYGQLVDCYYGIYEQEKPKNNCGYPEKELA